jgi:polyisoprenoid-binding protein YceI
MKPFVHQPAPRRTSFPVRSVRLSLLVLAACAFAPGVFAQQPGNVIGVHFSPAQTHIQWNVKTTLHTVYGTFDLKGGLVTIDTSTGEAQGELVVELASGKSGDANHKDSKDRDQKMQNDVLNSAQYPEAIFHPTRVTGSLKPGSKQQVSIEGTFTIHGADHPLILHGTIERHASDAKANLTFTIPYVDWGMKNPGKFPLRVASTVDVTVDAEATIEKPKV